MALARWSPIRPLSWNTCSLFDLLAKTCPCPRCSSITQSTVLLNAWFSLAVDALCISCLSVFRHQTQGKQLVIWRQQEARPRDHMDGVTQWTTSGLRVSVGTPVVNERLPSGDAPTPEDRALVLITRRLDVEPWRAFGTVPSKRGSSLA